MLIKCSWNQPQVSISSTFYAHIFVQNFGAKDYKASCVLVLKFWRQKFCTKNAHVKCWWNWPLVVALSSSCWLTSKSQHRQSFMKSFLPLTKKYKNKLQVQKADQHFCTGTKKLLSKCWWHWPKYVTQNYVQQFFNDNNNWCIVFRNH